MRRIVLPLALVFLFMFSSFMVVEVTGQTAEKSGLFPTDKGSSIRLNLTLNHAGLDSTLNVPTLNVNQSHTLTVRLEVVELGTDARDIHDIAVFTEISKENFLSGSDLFYSGAHFDDSSLVAGDVVFIEVPIFPVGSSERIEDADLKVTVSVKEDVQLNVDPQTVFNTFSYDIVLQPDETITNVTVQDGNTTTTTTRTPLDRESDVEFSITIGYEADSNRTEKRVIYSYTPYSVSFRLKVIALGPDVQDIHDFEVSLLLEDTSITDYLPNSDSEKYYALSLASEESLGVNDTITLDTLFYVNTNANETDVKLSVKAKVKEALDLLPDPSTTIADFDLDFYLNLLPEETDDSPASFTYMFIFALVALPILRKIRK